MITLSATQAISPAIERTKYFLFKSFRLGRFLKLTLVALFTEGGMASCNFGNSIPSGNGGGSSHPMPPFHMPHLPQTHEAWLPILIGAAAVIVLIVIPVMILISYLLIRLRFSYFECVLRMQDRIGPAWARYHRQALRYLGLSWCIGLAVWVVLGVVGYNLYQRFKPLFDAMGSDHKPTFADFLPLIGIVLVLVMVLAIVGSLVNTALSYFVLPHMALEDASIMEALSDVWSDIIAEPWQYIFFILLRFLTTLAASIIGMIGLIIPLLVVVAVGAVIVILLKMASTGLAVMLGVPAGILLLGIFFLAGIGVSGTIGTYRRNYALLFYGGRYPPLGNILQPPMPMPPAPPLPPTPAWEPGNATGIMPGV
jgi:hypothetical protein